MVIVLILSNQLLAQRQTPAETIESFYKFHLSRVVIFSLHELKLRKRWFAPELYRLLLFELKREDEFSRKNPNDKPHLGDGFPFQPFEECVVEEKIIRNRYEVKEISSSSNKALVQVSFFVPKECGDKKGNNLIKTYKIELLKTGKVWLIEDWIYSEGIKLSTDLRREKY